MIFECGACGTRCLYPDGTIYRIVQGTLIVQAPIDVGPSVLLFVVYVVYPSTRWGSSVRRHCRVVYLLLMVGSPFFRWCSSTRMITGSSGSAFAVLSWPHEYAV